MPEGPSLILFKEDLQRLQGQQIIAVSGSSKIDQQRLVHKQIRELKTWGKHLLWCFDGFTIRFHFLMFGTYYLNSEKDRIPRLTLYFENDYLNLYACAVKMIDEPLNNIYDWTADVLSEQWNPKAAAKKLKAIPQTMVTDALLDQAIFSGVGNIIKNEILHRIQVHPQSIMGALPPGKRSALIREAAAYSKDFLAWKRISNTYLRGQWQVHTKKTCPRDGTIISKEHLGQTDRRTFFCATCQKRYG